MPGNGWRIAPGTWVRLRRGGELIGEWGRVIRVEGNGSFRIETDGCGDVATVREDFRVKQDRRPPHNWFPMRKTLPYGQYCRQDGSRVLFNRDYEPLVEIGPEGERRPCDPHEHVQFDSQEWFYGDEGVLAMPWRDSASLECCVGILTG